MGYTHYWDNPGFSDVEWEALLNEADDILGQCPDLCWEYDQPDRLPEIGPDVIRFNGKGGSGHETFYLEKTPAREFAFCKTALKPYDSAVIAILAAAKAANQRFDWSSDGGDVAIADGETIRQQFLNAS